MSNNSLPTIDSNNKIYLEDKFNNQKNFTNINNKNIKDGLSIAKTSTRSVNTFYNCKYKICNSDKNKSMKLLFHILLHLLCCMLFVISNHSLNYILRSSTLIKSFISTSYVETTLVKSKIASFGHESYAKTKIYCKSNSIDKVQGNFNTPTNNKRTTKNNTTYILTSWILHMKNTSFKIRDLAQNRMTHASYLELNPVLNVLPI